jgi:hypothetical protein
VTSGRTAELTGAEIVVLWRARYFRDLGHEDISLITAQQRSRATATIGARIAAWANGDPALIWRFVSDAFRAWTDFDESDPKNAGRNPLLPDFGAMFRTDSPRWRIWRAGPRPRPRR